MVTQVPSGGLTSLEELLVEHVACGEWLDLAVGGEAIDEAAMRSWGDSQTCRAAVIRDILRGRLVADPDPHGLRLRGARIAGRLDLQDLATNVHLELQDCLLEEGVCARRARLAGLVLTGCHIEHPAEPPLDGVRLTCSVLGLDRIRVIGHAGLGAVRLSGAQIGGRLDCAGAELSNDSGPALLADGLQVSRGMFLRDGFTATGSGEAGAVRLSGAQIGGRLDCAEAELSNDSGPAMRADGLHVDHDMWLCDGFSARGSGDDGAVDLLGAHIGGQLACTEAELTNDSGPALLADGLQVDQSVFLRDGFTAAGSGDRGAVDLFGAHIGGQLDCAGAELRNDSGPALMADGLQVDRDAFLRDGFTATGSGPDCTVRLPGARIGGRFDCTGAKLHNDSGPALHADNLQVDRGVFLRRGFTATGSGDLSAVRLIGARIGANLECDGAKLHNDSGPALNADSLHVGQGIWLRDGFTATGSGEAGAVRLAGAHVGRQLDCTGADLRNDSGPALIADGLEVGQDMQCDRLTADGGVVLGGHIGRLLSFEGAALNNRGGIALSSDGLRVDGTMFCRNGFTAQGEIRLPGAQIGGRLYLDGARLSNPGGRALVASRLTVGQDMFCRKQKVPEHEQPFVVEGTIDLRGAHIGGHFECDGAQLRSESGPALNADSLHVDQDMYMRGRFTATGAGKAGAVRLSGARIGGSLECDEAQLRNDSGPALYADRLQVDQSMFLRDGFTAIGNGGNGTLYLVGAQISGHLDCTKAELRNDSGPALYAYSLQVGQGMYLGGGFTATGGGEEGAAVNLTDARVGGKFVFALECLEHRADSHRRLAVSGLTYADVPDTGSDGDWRDLLRQGTPGYAAQPYQQLAAGYRARGDDRQARQTLMAQRDDQLARTHASWRERWWGRITKVTLGYGYQPWRALWFLAAVVAVSCVLAVVLGAHGALAQTSTTATPGRTCTVVQRVSVGLDLNLPMGTSVARVDCDLAKDSASATAAWLSAVGWVLRLLAWVFAALFIAGFTSAVRKT